MARRFTPLRLLVAGLALIIGVAVALWLIPSDSYIFLPDRPKPLAPIVHIQGAKDAGPGGIYLVDVLVRRANLFESLWPGIRSGSTLVPASAFDQPGVSQEERQQGDLSAMARSQDVAAALALRAIGRSAVLRTTGILVVEIGSGTPAVGKLAPGDVIVAVDGTNVRTRAELQRALGRPGRRVRLTVRVPQRGTRTVFLRTARFPEDPRRAFIGIRIAPAVQVHLPIRITFDTGDIGGPSAGLAFALNILEELGRNVDRGYRVAATGELEPNGAVAPIGGVKQKTIGARDGGIQVMLVPAGSNYDEARRYAGKMRVFPVRTLPQALRALATLPQVE